jgi:VWFA-related protein
MFYPDISVPRAPVFSSFRFFAILAGLLLAVTAAMPVSAQQQFEKALSTPEKVEVRIKNRNGRVVVSALDEQKGVTISGESPSASVSESDIAVNSIGGRVEINVRARREQERIDLTVKVPARSKVYVESEAGAVDIIGNVAQAEVFTDTGTIRAAVPTDAVRYDFWWQASRPRFFSDVELGKIKEKAGGTFQIKGKLGDEKAEKEERVELSFATQRGVVLFNVDPDQVPTDLKERPLTDAAKAIVNSGDVQLAEAVRKVSPRLFGEYTKGLTQLRGDGPSLVQRRSPKEYAEEVAPQLMRVNATVTDRYGRAVSGLSASDFTVTENGQPTQVKEVRPTNAPFNLVLLLDVSGSVEERIDFIRKAARNFLSTASPQDRIAIVSFRDDIQVISDFTTDRRLLSQRLDQIDAGGATALYDALAYVMVTQIKQLRGERTAVVILSDGDDNKSFIPFSTVLGAVLESGALIYPLYVPSGLIPESSVATPSATLDPLRTRYLTITTRAEQEAQKLATLSGGVYYPIRQIDDLQRAYDDVVAQLRMAYTITYASNTGSSRRISVRTNRGDAAVRLSPPVDFAQRTNN